MAEPKLSKKHREDVERAYQYEDAERPFLDYYKSELEQRLPKLLENQSPAEAQLPEEQQLASAVRWMLHGNGPFIRAVAKRLVEDSPGEMARSASLYARLEPWHGLLDEYDDFLNLTWSLFPALAAILRDEDLLAAAVAAFDEWKKPKKTVAAMAEVFRALHRRDPGEVVRALEELLAMSRKIWHLFEVFNIVSFETHGLYELCRWIDPALVEGFETDRPLPWDSGLWRWVRDHDGESPFHDVSELSPVLQQWLVELPFKADREHYWPGGVREAPPRRLSTGPRRRRSRSTGVGGSCSRSTPPRRSISSTL